MSNDKMREEFESWYRKNHAWPPESDPLEKVGGEYVFGPIRYRWQTWQASRAAITVQLSLTEDLGFGEAGTASAETWNAAMKTIAYQLEALGLKVVL